MSRDTPRPLRIEYDGLVCIASVGDWGLDVEYRLRVRVEGGHRVPSTFILGQKRDHFVI